MTIRHKLSSLRTTSMLAIMTAAVLALPGAAAAADNPDEENLVSEIVVTASKREERLFDVPAAVSALTGESLTQRNLLQLEDFAAQVPGLNFQAFGNRATRIILRGLNSGGANANVAILIDEAALSYSSGTSNGAIDIANLDTFDLNRVEVLRGPQGTLYGAAAEGGIIKYVTNAPNLTEMQAGVEAETETVKDGGTGYTVRGYLSVPIVKDKAAFRITGFYKDIPGYADNAYLGTKDVNDGERYGGRAQLLFKPTENLSIKLAAFIQKQHFNDDGLVNVKGAVFTFDDPPANQFDLVGSSPQHNGRIYNPSENETQLYSMVVDYDAKFATLSSLTSYGTVDTFFNTNVTDSQIFPGFTYGDLFGLPIVDGGYGQPTNVKGRQQNKLEKFNQEFRISSNPGSTFNGMKFDWQAGLFYSHEDIVFTQFYDAVSDATGEVLTFPYVLGGSNLPADYNEYSGYASATLHFDDHFNISAGARYSESWQTSQVSSYAGFLNGPTDTLNDKVAPPREKVTTWSVAPQYKFDENHIVYARVATGFRPGGPELLIPGAPPDFPQSYHSDATINYEAGFKGQLFDRKLSVDVAAFYIEWTDIQILAQYISEPSGVPFNVTGNAGSAVSQGIEFDFGYTPFRGLDFGLVGAYTDAKLTRDALTLGAHDGDQLPYVPKWAVTFNADYRWPLTDKVEGFVGGSVSYTGERYGDFSPAESLGNHVKLPSYTTFNMQAGVEVDKFTLTVFGSNLSNEQTPLTYSPTGGQNATGYAQIVRPRTFGARISYRY
jgi:iron complex outermembrane receptor protein